MSRMSALTRELNPLEAPFLPIDDPRFLWLKYQGIKKGIKINVHTVIEQAYKVFDYKVFD